MQTEKIFIREDKSRVKLFVALSIERWGSNAGVHWDFSVTYCDPGKRTFKGVLNTDDNAFRRLSFPDGQNAFRKEKYMEYVSPQELLEVKMELWQKLKPTL